MLEVKDLTKYERTRILGARALQVSMDAPLLKEIKQKELEEMKYNPMKIAKQELEEGVLPITVKQPMPEKKSVKIKKIKEEVKDKEIVEKELEEEKKIEEGGEIMELANPEDEEVVEEVVEGREASEELR